MTKYWLCAQSVYASAPDPAPVLWAMGIATVLVIGLITWTFVEWLRRKP